MKSFSSIERFSRLMLVLAMLVVAGVAIAFLLLALPANDDFVRASLTAYVPQRNQMGALQYCEFLYTHWQGRWVSFGLESAVLPRVEMIRLYPCLIGAVDLVSFIGLFAVCRFFTRSASRWFSLACSLSLAAVLWAQMPSVAQTVYWFVGGIENQMVLALAGMLLVGLVRMRASIPWIIFASLLAIVTTGFHEAYGAMLCIALAAGTVAAFWMGSENRWAWLVVLCAATAGLGVVVLAPGNRYRMDRDVSHRVRHVSVVLRLTFKQFWNSGREWLFDPKLLAASLFVAFSPRLEASRPVWITAGRVPWRLLVPAAWLAMLCVGFFLPSWAFVDEMPRRTLSGNFIVFAMGWLLVVFVCTRKLDARDPVSASIAGLRSGGATSIALLVLAAGLVLGGNTLEGIHDLATRKVLHWRTSVEKRYADLRRHPGEDLVLPRLAPSSRLFYSGEVYFDPTNWTNRAIADFFHLKSVLVLPVAGQDPTTAPAVETEKPSQNM